MIGIDAIQEWPRMFARDTLTAICIDSKSMWIHFALLDDHKRIISTHFQCPWRDLPLHVRISDCTDELFMGDNEHSAVLLCVPSDVDHVYYRSLSSGRDYAVDFGLLLPSGSFFAILRSTLPIHCPDVYTHCFSPVTFLPVGETCFSSTRVQVEEVTSRHDQPYNESLIGYVSGKKGVN